MVRWDETMKNGFQSNKTKYKVTKEPGIYLVTDRNCVVTMLRDGERFFGMIKLSYIGSGIGN